MGNDQVHLFKPHSVYRIKFLTQNHVTVISFNFKTNVWKKTVRGKSWIKWNVCVTPKSNHDILCGLENNARNQVNLKISFKTLSSFGWTKERSNHKNGFGRNNFIFAFFLQFHIFISLTEFNSIEMMHFVKLNVSLNVVLVWFLDAMVALIRVSPKN